MTLAEELMGLVPLPAGRQGRAHVCEDQDEPEDPRPNAVRIREWCETTTVRISMRSVMDEFGVSPGYATTTLQRFGRMGILSRAFTATSTGGRRMQIWKFNRQSITN